MPLAINLFGTDARMAKALGVDRLDEHGERIAALLRPELPTGLGGLREALESWASYGARLPRRYGARRARTWCCATTMST